MDYNNLTAEQKEIFDAGEEAGYENGFDSGWQACENDPGIESYDQGYADGIKAERQRVQDVLNMMFEASINMGQGNKAVQYRNVMELLQPVEMRAVSEDD
jgi:hypothetical protein